VKRLPRACKTCNHPEVGEINKELLMDVPVDVVAKRYNLPYFSVWRHKKNHLQEEIRQWRKVQAAKTKQAIKSTIEYYDELLAHFMKKMDEIMEQGTLRDFLRLLKDRSELLGEERVPPRIEIVWGAGIEEAKKEEAFKPQEVYTIKIPVKEKSKDERGD